VTAAEVALIIMWASVTAYALLGGADFGAGLWDLLAGGGSRGQAHRRLIDRAIGPVWEANHVWLIFVLVLLWTAFPRAVPPLMTTLYGPLMLVALGIILRGTGFALRSTLTGRLRPLLSTTFAASSLVTPWFLGTFAGAVASGRVPGDPSTSWLHPVSLAGGTLAVACCAYLGAVYICGEADRVHQADLAADFRLRALLASAACASATLVGAVILHLDAPQLFHGFTHRALPISLLSALAALVSIGLLVARRYRSARVAAAIGVAAVLWAWGIAQWPYMVPPTLTVAGAAAATPTLDALIVTAAVGSVLLLPALACLFVLKGRGLLREPDTENPLAPVTTSSPDL
jgi:cytochrome d ubiquinol oxidase subunit II